MKIYYKKFLNRVISFILVIFFIFLSFNILNSIIYKNSIDSLFKKLTPNEFSFLSDNIIQDKYENLRDSKEGINALYEFNSFLKSNENFNYVEINNNPIYVFFDSYKVNIELRNNYENHQNDSHKFDDRFAIKTFSLGDNAQEYFNINMCEGNFFNNLENINSSNISLLLGNNYIDFYDINDKVPFIYLGEEFTGIVRGFLDKDSSLIYQNFEYNLNNYVFLSLDELTDLKCFYDNEDKNKNMSFISIKNNGTIIPNNKNMKEIEKAINKKSLSLNIPLPSFIVGYYEIENDIKKLDIRIFIELCLIILIILVVIIKIYKNRKKIL